MHVHLKPALRKIMKHNSLRSNSAKQVCVEAHSRCFYTPSLCDCNCSHLSFLMILYTEKKLVLKATKMCTFFGTRYGQQLKLRILSVMRWVDYVWLEPVRHMFRMRSADSSAQEDGGNVRASHYTKLWKTHLQLQGGLITVSKLATFDLHLVLLLQGN